MANADLFGYGTLRGGACLSDVALRQPDPNIVPRFSGLADLPESAML